MKDIIEIFSNILSEHILLLLAFSVSWILIFYSLRGLKGIGSYLVIRFPYHIKMHGWRMRQGIKRQQQKIGQGLISDPKRADLLDRVVADKISEIDKEISDRVIGKGVERFLFDEQYLNAVYDEIRKNEMELLEKDHAISGIYSSNDRRRSSGLLNLIGHPKAADAEILASLLHLVDAGNIYTRRNARYHFEEFIERRKNNEKSIGKILGKWSPSMRNRGEELIKRIKDEEKGGEEKV